MRPTLIAADLAPPRWYAAHFAEFGSGKINFRSKNAKPVNKPLGSIIIVSNLMKKLLFSFGVISALLASCTQADTVPTPDPAIVSRIDELITGYTEEGEFSGSVLIAEKGFVVVTVRLVKPTLGCSN